jgi:hypothetical protein
MCVNFTSLNKVCSKDNFTLHKINRLVDSITKFEYLSSFGANLGCH